MSDYAWTWCPVCQLQITTRFLERHIESDHPLTRITPELLERQLAMASRTKRPAPVERPKPVRNV